MRVRCTSIRCVRTTLDIADDVLRAAKETAKRQKKTTGEVISEWARSALTRAREGAEGEAVCGFRPFPARGRIVTDETIDQLRDERPY